MSTEDDDNNPEVIKAKADAEVRILEARAKLHPAAQFVFTLMSSLGKIIEAVGCLVILAIIILALFAPSIIQRIGR